MIKAILMAGGKGTRLKSKIEKPLFMFQSTTLIEHVLSSLYNSKYIEEILVAVSPHTPKTTEYITKKKLNNRKKNLNHSRVVPEKKIVEKIIETPGKGYIKDLSFLLDYCEKNSKNDILLIINVDLPFVTPEIIDDVLENYFESEKSAMSVQVPINIFNKFGIKPSYELNNLVPSGLNILTSQNIEQVEEKLIIPKVELALNINTLDDILVAKEIFNKKE